MSGLFCTFWIDEHLFGVPIGGVQEVLLGQTMTPVPLAPSEVPGLLNLRGQIVTVIDLRARLCLPPRDAAQTSDGVNVIIGSADGAVSLLADRVGEVLSPADGCFEDPPDTIDRRVRDLVSAVCKLDGQLLLVLDIDTTIAVGGAA
jgi:purine-binding chemotaxis protein CheW